MKVMRILALILAMCFLAGCSQPAEIKPQEETVQESENTLQEPENEVQESEDTVQEPVEQFVFTRENFPKMDGSTSTVPLGEAIASVLLGETREKVSDLIQFNKTTESYRSLMLGDADILIAAEPAEVIWEEKETQKFEWEMEPFAVDGLVFVVNENNPVDSLTIEQVQKIYSGEITNWSQVGGDDIEIIPFQRNEEAGSQTAMLKHVMKDIPIMEAPREYVSKDMSGLIDAVSNYDNSPAAIGYTMYYYAEDMKMADGLKIIAIDGVEPNDDTIRSGEYPFLNNYYVLTATGLSEDDPAKVMFDWILSEEGQRLVAHEGYVPVMDIENAEDGISPVYTDWSKLTPYEGKSIYTYFEPRSEDGYLQPRDDYGILLDYMGEIKLEKNGDEYLLGLVTTDGRLVTEPVYDWIYFTGKFIMLGIEHMPAYNNTNNSRDVTSFKYYVAASDGSWIRELDSYCGDFLIDKNHLAIRMDDLSLIILNKDGSEVEFPASVFKSHFGSSFDWHQVDELIGNGSICLSTQDDEDSDNLYLDIITGEVLSEPKGNYSRMIYGSIDSDYDEATSDLISEIREDYYCYYSRKTGEVIFSYPILNNTD